MCSTPRTAVPARASRSNSSRSQAIRAARSKPLLTNDDGRCDQPLLEGEALVAGEYELVFGAGDYFASIGTKVPEPRFVDRVVLRFGVADASAHYHVPLLVSPWSYSTYRGS